MIESGKAAHPGARENKARSTVVAANFRYFSTFFLSLVSSLTLHLLKLNMSRVLQ